MPEVVESRGPRCRRLRADDGGPAASRIQVAHLGISAISHTLLALASAVPVGVAEVPPARDGLA
jgi:hypothetical protein